MDESKSISSPMKPSKSSKTNLNRSKSSKSYLKRSKSSEATSGSSSDVKCSTCPLVFSGSEALEKHRAKCRSWACSSCGSRFKTMEALGRHIKEHYLPQQKEDEDKKIEEEELKKLLSQISFECSICELVFQTPEDFTDHRRESHNIQPEIISQSSTWQPDDDDDDDDEEYKKFQEKGYESFIPCRFCNESFPSSKSLEHHIYFDHHPSLIPIMEAMETGQKVEKKIGDVDVDVDDGEEKEIWIASETAIIALRMLAQVALKHYNNQNPSKRYALVAHGPNVSTGTIDHVNFKAKEEDCIDAPVETFFAQLTIAPFMRVDCCVCLGPSRNLPHRRKGVELGGCRFCRPIIHHPRESERVANLILDPCSYRPNF